MDKHLKLPTLVHYTRASPVTNFGVTNMTKKVKIRITQDEITT